MDYEIKPTSRHELRLYAKLFRSICGFSQDEPIDPIPLLDRLPDLEGFEMFDTKSFTIMCCPAMFPRSAFLARMVISFKLRKAFISELWKKGPVDIGCT